MLDAHNKYRALHGVPMMTINKKINAIAQAHAEYLGTSGLFQHSGVAGYGENIAALMLGGTPDVKNCSSIFLIYFKKLDN